MPALLWMGWIFWLSSQQALPPPPGISYTIAAIAGHFVLYAVLMLLLLVAIDMPQQPRAARVKVALAIALIYAVSDEFHQSFVPGREASVFDIVVDTCGASCTAIAWMVGWRRIATY